jgi:hypothetical protein
MAGIAVVSHLRRINEVTPTLVIHRVVVARESSLATTSATTLLEDYSDIITEVVAEWCKQMKLDGHQVQTSISSNVSIAPPVNTYILSTSPDRMSVVVSYTEDRLVTGWIRDGHVRKEHTLGYFTIYPVLGLENHAAEASKLKREQNAIVQHVAQLHEELATAVTDPIDPTEAMLVTKCAGLVDAMIVSGTETPGVSALYNEIVVLVRNFDRHRLLSREARDQKLQTKQ